VRDCSGKPGSGNPLRTWNGKPDGVIPGTPKSNAQNEYENKQSVGPIKGKDELFEGFYK